jgi:predicted nucleic acid-binding protein
VANPPVVNSSPLILLAHGGAFDLLRAAWESILVPSSVAIEIRRRGPTDPTVLAMSHASWLTMIPDPPIPPAILSWDLGMGESAVLAWAYANPGTEAICDDLAARRCATTLGIPVRGTVALVLGAKQRGRIDKARPVLENLVRAGMYLSERVLNDALEQVGE